MDILIFDNDVCFGMKLKEKINNILIKEGFDNDVVRLYHNANLLLKELTEKNKVRIYFIVVDAKYKISNELCDGLWIAQKLENQIILVQSYFLQII